eukprot:13395190-Alexandrium_andersonii.AAC.1
MYVLLLGRCTGPFTISLPRLNGLRPSRAKGKPGWSSWCGSTSPTRGRDLLLRLCGPVRPEPTLRCRASLMP